MLPLQPVHLMSHVTLIKYTYFYWSPRDLDQIQRADINTDTNIDIQIQLRKQIQILWCKISRCTRALVTKRSESRLKLLQMSLLSFCHQQIIVNTIIIIVVRKHHHHHHNVVFGNPLVCDTVIVQHLGWNAKWGRGQTEG